MMLRSFLFLSCFFAVAAFAQVQPIVVPEIAIRLGSAPTSDTFTFGAGECTQTERLVWTNTITSIPSLFNLCSMNNLKLWATSGDCMTASASDVHFEDAQYQLVAVSPKSGEFNVTISQLPDFAQETADGGTSSCGSHGVSKTHTICGSVDYAPAISTCGSVQKYYASPLKMIYDTQPPAAPVITEAGPQDSAVVVKFTASSDATKVTIEVRKASPDGGYDLPDGGYVDYDPPRGETLATNGLIRAEGLENQVLYDVRLRALDAAGNQSLPSESVQLMPVLTEGFWGRYKDAGGTEQGGCSVAIGTMPLVLALFAVRRSRKSMRVSR